MSDWHKKAPSFLLNTLRLRHHLWWSLQSDKTSNSCHHSKVNNKELLKNQLNYRGKERKKFCLITGRRREREMMMKKKVTKVVLSCSIEFDISECYRLQSFLLFSSSITHTHTHTGFPQLSESSQRKLFLLQGLNCGLTHRTRTHLQACMHTYSYRTTRARRFFGDVHIIFYSSFVIQLCTERNFSRTGINPESVRSFQ